MSLNRQNTKLKTIFSFNWCTSAMGPILPQINVFGKELGISPDVMGFITSLLPILYILAKPAVGYLIDAFPVSFLHSSLYNNWLLLLFWTFDAIFSHFAEYSEDNIYVDHFSDDNLLCRFLLCSKNSITKYTQTAVIQFHRNQWPLWSNDDRK